MNLLQKKISTCLFAFTCSCSIFAQKTPMVKLVKDPNSKKIDVFIGQNLFTTFLYPDTLEKPVLYPVFSTTQTDVTRGFPMNPKSGDPTDHPHHIGIWFNFENVNGLDFWNNSFAIPAEKKNLYGWIKTNKITEMKNGKTGVLGYHANWTNQKNEILLEETTQFEFSQSGTQRIIDRSTILTANTEVKFNDSKDGFIGIRLAHELQISAKEDQKFTDDKGNITLVKGGTDNIANGNYITSEGKSGDAVWGTRAIWCQVYGKIGKDSISVLIIDHPKNPNYPTFWHARGYGLFAANPLGEKIFTNGKSSKNLQLKKGENVSFRYRIVVNASSSKLSNMRADTLAEEFSRK